MATTAGGWPYPVATDPVAQGAAAIQALAEASDTQIGRLRVASGNGQVTIATAGTAASTAVSFPAGRFTAAPTVMVTATGTTPGSLRGPMVTGVSATGCTVWASRDSATTAVNFTWLAIQVP